MIILTFCSNYTKVEVTTIQKLKYHNILVIIFFTFLPKGSIQQLFSHLCFNYFAQRILSQTFNTLYCMILASLSAMIDYTSYSVHNDRASKQPKEDQTLTNNYFLYQRWKWKQKYFFWNSLNAKTTQNEVHHKDLVLNYYKTDW